MALYNPNDGKHQIFVFALSTCVHCRRTKELLDEMGVNYGHVEVDLLDENEMAGALEEIGRYNPAQTFPTIIINSRVIVGYKPDDIRQRIDETLSRNK